jgi:hypothetical protein
VRIHKTNRVNFKIVKNERATTISLIHSVYSNFIEFEQQGLKKNSEKKKKRKKEMNNSGL